MAGCRGCKFREGESSDSASKNPLGSLHQHLPRVVGGGKLPLRLGSRENALLTGPHFSSSSPCKRSQLGNFSIGSGCSCGPKSWR